MTISKDVLHYDFYSSVNKKYTLFFFSFNTKNKPLEV